MKRLAKITLFIILAIVLIVFVLFSFLFIPLSAGDGFPIPTEENADDSQASVTQITLATQTQLPPPTQTQSIPATATQPSKPTATFHIQASPTQGSLNTQAAATPTQAIEATSVSEATQPANDELFPTTGDETNQENVGVSAMQQKLQDIQAQLAPGRLAYNPPETLAVGQQTILEVGIIPLFIVDQNEDEADQQLAEALETDIEELETATIRVSTLMHAEITGEESTFTIIPLHSNARQALAPDEPTEWAWQITALKPGTHHLTLTVTYIVNVNGNEEERHKTYEDIIEINIDPAITGKYLLNLYWLPLLITILSVGGLSAYFISKRLIFRKQKRALLAALATTSPEQGQGYIFISYAHVNEKFVIPLAQDLMKNGIRVWLDQREIRAGEDWMEEIEIGLAETDALMVVISPKSVASKYVMMEVEAAIKAGKTVFPVVYKMAELPEQLGKIHFVNFEHDYPTALETLVDNLKDAGFKNE